MRRCVSSRGRGGSAASNRAAPGGTRRGAARLPRRCCRARVSEEEEDGGGERDDRSRVGRRIALGGGALGVLASFSRSAQATLGPESNWPLWLALPVAPYSRRKTIRYEVGPKAWAFDQTIGIYYVQVPIRMTVIAMEGGGLFVYAPVAPTKECLSLLRPLIDDYGPVRYIVLPSVAVEHKVLSGPFARKFPRAEFYAASNQYAFPVNLPSSFLGLPSWTKVLPSSSDEMVGESAPWGGEFDHQVLRVKPGPGSDFQDAAFFHKPSKTMMICDAVFGATGEFLPLCLLIPRLDRAPPDERTNEC